MTNYRDKKTLLHKNIRIYEEQPEKSKAALETYCRNNINRKIKSE
jgi:hypothetical protein